MKLVPLILAIIIISQVAMPCCAMSTCHLDVDTELVSDTEHNDSEHSDTKGNCASLCCGASFVITKSELSIAPTPEDLEHYIFNYQFDYSFDFLDFVWHPPIV